MRKCWEMSVLLPYVGLLILFNAAWALAGNLGAVQNIHAVSGHEVNRPSQETIIEMVWSLPDGYTQGSIEGYYYRFDTLSEEDTESFSEINTLDLELIKNQTAISEDYESLIPDDLYVYFHVAAVALDEEEEPIFGSTQTVGPLRIDITAPKNVWVIAPEETASRNIILNFGSETSNIELYISNLSYGESGSGWIPFVSSKDWIISEGEGEKSIYVEFRDDAGNISKASTTTVFTTSDPLVAQHSSDLYLPGTNLSLSNTIAYTGTFASIKYLMELPQGWQLESTSVDNSNFLILANGNVEFSWNDMTSGDTGLNLPFTCSISVPYGESGDKQIQALVTYQLDDNAPIDEYAQPDPLVIAQKEQFYTMTVQFGENGNVTPDTPVVVSHGDPVIFSISPNEGYEVDQFLINGQVYTISDGSYTIAHAIEDVNLDVTFKRIELEITVNAGEDGNVQPGSQSVFYGDSLSFEITPDKGYRIENLLLNNFPIQITQNTLVLDSIKKDYVIDVTFEKIPETITARHETSSFFIPGEAIEVELNIDFTGFLTAMGFEIQLPDGFTYQSVDSVNGPSPEVQYISSTNNLSFAWVSLVSESISVKYILTSPENASGKIDLLGELKYRFTDQSEVEETNNANTHAVMVIGKHTNLTGPYEVGTEISVANTIEYTGNISALTLDVNLPEGWEYVSSEGSTIPDSLPSTGEQDNISFQWTDLTEDISFVYTVKAGETSKDTVEIRSVVLYAHDDNDLQSNMIPKQLFIEPAYLSTIQEASTGYVSGIPFMVNNRIDFNGEIENLEYHVVIPEGWLYTAISGESTPDTITPTDNEIDFSWENIPQSPVKFTYTLIPGDYTLTANTISATVTYQRNDNVQTISANPAVITVTEGEFLVSHSLLSSTSGDVAWYTPGQELTINNTIIYSDELKIDDENPNRLAALGYRVGLPDGWTLKSKTGNMMVETVSYGVEFSWTQPPDSPVQFTYTLQVPEATSGIAEIAAMAVYRVGNESQGENIERAQPDPLILYNVQAPTVIVNSGQNSPTQSNAIPITVTFSKPVSGFLVSDVVISNGSVAFFSGSGAIYTFIVTPDKEGTVTISIPENIAIDMVGSGNEPSEPFNIIVDQTRPTVNISSDIPEYVSTSPWAMTIIFSEQVMDFSKNDISISNGTIQDFESSENPIFVISVLPDDQGKVSVSIPSDIAKDVAGNMNYPSIAHIRTYDNIPPTLTLKGDEIVRIEVGETYIDQGATAVDQIDGNISDDKIQIDNQVNDQLVGVYKVFYEVSDRAGNEQTAERTVYVEPDTITPTVQTEAGGYLPGNDYIVSVTVRFKTGCSALGYELILPDDWGFDSVWGSNVPDVIRLDNDKILGFAWHKEINSIDSVSFSYAIQVPESASGNYTLPAKIKYRYADQGELLVNATVQALEQSVIALHSSKDVYLKGNAIPIDVDIHLSTDAYDYNEFTAIGLIVHLPQNWTFDRAYGEGAPISTVTGIVPDQGSSDILQFAWFNILNNSISFTYDVIPPESTADSTETITATVKYRFANGIERSARLLPSELRLEPAKLSIKHQCGSVYVPNMEIPVDNVITYNGASNTLSNMQLSVYLPTGWSLTDISGIGKPQDMTTNNDSILLKWIGNVPASPIVFSYALIPNSQSDEVNLSAELSYQRFNTILTEKVLPDPIILTKGDFAASQSMNLPSTAGFYFYTPGENINIQNSIVYSGDLSGSNMRFIISLPESWDYVNSSLGLSPELSANQVVFEWTQAPSSPIAFSYQVKVPSYDYGKRMVSAVVEYMNNSKTVQVLPHPLIAYDNLPPKPQVQSNLGETTAVSSMDFTLTFSKPVSGLEREDILVQNALLNDLTPVNEYTFKLNLTPISQGEVSINLLANSVTDFMGNGNTALLPSYSVIYDSIAPEVAYLGTSAPTTTNSDMIPVTLIFTEPVSGFLSSHINITNGSIKNFEKNGTTYTFDIDPDEQGDVSISIDSGILKDNAGNSNQIQQSLLRTYDSIRPSVMLSVNPDMHTLDMIQPITLTVQMSEKVSYFDQSDISIQNGMIENYQVKTDDQIFQAIIQPLECGYITISVPENAASDMAGNMSLASDSIQLTMNCTTYTGVVRDNNQQALENVNVNVVFPEDIKINDVRTDSDGKYSLNLPKSLFSDKYFFSIEKEGYVFEDMTFSLESDTPVGFKVELPDQVMHIIADMGYGYTIAGTVIADGKNIKLVNNNNSVVKIYTVHSDSSGQATVANDEGEFFIGFDTVPSSPFIIVASMKDYYIEKTINPDVSSGNVILNMQLIEVDDDISVNVSVDFGAEVEVETDTGDEMASVEIPPGAIDTIEKSAKVEMQVSKIAPESKSIKLASKTGGQLLEIKIDSPIKEGKELIIALKISGEDISSEDFKSGKYFIFYADTKIAFLSGVVKKIPYGNILKFGSIIKFKVDHLTVFGVGEDLIDEDLPRLKDEDGGQRRCFISTLQQTPTFHSLYVFIILTIMIGAIGLTRIKQSFFGQSKRYEKLS
ncbi:conserved hypothetical protein, membrane [Candidatus Magnetomorum sp. HK-1]|nr:conserved hypothetical protein, membrane [Candidatus Magnetomorum sp. HK-1]